LSDENDRPTTISIAGNYLPGTMETGKVTNLESAVVGSRGQAQHSHGYSSQTGAAKEMTTAGAPDAPLDTSRQRRARMTNFSSDLEQATATRRTARAADPDAPQDPSRRQRARTVNPPSDNERWWRPGERHEQPTPTLHKT